MSQNLHFMRQAASWYSLSGPLKMQLPYIRGNWYFVTPGLNTAGIVTAGTDPRQPLQSINDAYTKCKTGNGDGICMISYGTTSAGCTSYLTASLDWSKWGITVVGISAPTMMAQRSRISNDSDNTDLAYLIDMQGSNNAFYNLHIANFGSDAAAVGGIKVTGERNYFGNCHIIGGGGHTGTDDDYDMHLAGNENTFERCVFGSDTHDKGDKTNCNVLFASGGLCARDRFIDCEFLSYHSAGTTAGALRSGNAASIARPIIFKNCDFIAYDDAAVLSEASVLIGTVPTNGYFMFRDCVRHGYTDWCAVAATASVYTNSPAGDEAGGAFVAANPS